MYFNDFLGYYVDNSMMLFDKYINDKEKRDEYYEHYVNRFLIFLRKLKTYSLLVDMFNKSFMKLKVVNDDDFVDKQFDREYFAAMYFAKFTFDVYNKDYKEGTFGEVVACIIYFFDNGCCDLDELRDIMKLDEIIWDIYKKYTDKHIFKAKRRRMIRNDIDRIFTEATQKFISTIPEYNKLDINDMSQASKIAKLTYAADKMLSFVKTLVVISFEGRLYGITWDSTADNRKLYKDMWECKWDASFKKNKVMPDFLFMFYKIYYRLLCL